MSQPPRTGPKALVIAVKPDQVPMASPRESSSNEALMIARLPGTSKAAPIPCKQRAMISWWMLAARPHAADAAAKIPTPIRNIRRRPNKSPSAPPARINADKSIPYDSTTHCTSKTLALKLVCNAGMATLTTVLSTKAILEPRIVAVRIHGRAVPAHGTPALAERIKLSSQGVLISYRCIAFGIGYSLSDGLQCYTQSSRAGCDSPSPGTSWRNRENPAPLRVHVLAPVKMRTVAIPSFLNLSLAPAEAVSSRLASLLNRFQKLQQVRVNLISVCGEQAVWFARIEN
jgi:hypothetical protein